MKGLAEAESMVVFYLQPIVETRSVFNSAQNFLVALGETTMELHDLEFYHC